MTTTSSAMIPRGTIADSAATIARFVLDHVRNSKRSGWWIVFMDEERRLWEPPRLLRDKPVKAEGGRVGSGLTRNLQSAVDAHKQQRLGPSSYVVVHFLGDCPRQIGADDLGSVRRWTQCDAPRTNDIETETPEVWISKRAVDHPWSMVFFEDLLCLWEDGAFESVRDALRIEPEGSRT